MLKNQHQGLNHGKTRKYSTRNKVWRKYRKQLNYRCSKVKGNDRVYRKLMENNPARTNDTISVCSSFCVTCPAKLKSWYTLLKRLVTLSLIVAKSGIKPMYQNTKETEKYVDMANILKKRIEVYLQRPKLIRRGKPNISHSLPI